ncbi:hypothetical protein CAP36_16970 [Chitinophagaceae bacterium IBVUCB2]|nr:hypothetical protein CAP36_16970 [Chitinophagaceae bacterium IBVUCB2]
MKAIIITLLAFSLLTACTNHGKKVTSKHIEMFYKDGVTESQAQQAADILYRLDSDGSSESMSKKSFQLLGNGDTITCKMVVNEAKANEVPDQSFIIIGNRISDSAFNGKPVNMVLTDDKFKPLRTIAYAKLSAGEEDNDFGEKITSGNVEVYSLEGVSMDEAEALAKFLEKEMAPQTVISFQLSKEADGVNTVKMASYPEKTKDTPEASVNEIMTKMSQQIFNNTPVSFQFADIRFKPYRTYTYNP